MYTHCCIESLMHICNIYTERFKAHHMRPSLVLQDWYGPLFFNIKGHFPLGQCSGWQLWKCLCQWRWQSWNWAIGFWGWGLGGQWSPWKFVVGRLLSCWEGLFSRDMLVLGRVSFSKTNVPSGFCVFFLQVNCLEAVSYPSNPFGTLDRDLYPQLWIVHHTFEAPCVLWMNYPLVI